MNQLLLLLALLGQPSSPTVFPVSVKPQAAADDAPAIQSAVDAGFAANAATPHAGAVVTLAGRTPYYQVQGPIYLDGNNLEVRGDGKQATWVRTNGGYYGPVFVVGVQRQPPDVLAKLRPNGLLGGRALATCGTHALAVAGHPIQLGGVDPAYGGLTPDYWGGPAYTWEFVLEKPAGATWTNNDGLFGFRGNSQPPAPWTFIAGTPGTISFACSTTDGALRWATFPTPGPGPWKVTFQADFEGGSYSAWVDGKPQPVTPAQSGISGTTPIPKKSRLVRHDGCTPWILGSTLGDIPYQSGVTNVTLHGYRASQGLIYTAGAPTETRVDGRPVGDWRFFYGEPGYSACFPADDSPATHVRILGMGRWGVGFWIPAARPMVSTNLGVTDMQLESQLQPPIQVAAVYGLNLKRIDAGRGGLQGIGSLPVAASYPIVLEDVDVSGAAAAYVGVSQILEARRTNVAQSGREGVLMAGGGTSWADTFFAFQYMDTEAYFRFITSEYGQNHRLTDTKIDNESSVPSVTFIECATGTYCPSRLILDGLETSLTGGMPLVRLVGNGNPAKLDARNVQPWNRAVTGPVLEVLGSGWKGTFDTSEITNATAKGDGAAGIKLAP